MKTDRPYALNDRHDGKGNSVTTCPKGPLATYKRVYCGAIVRALAGDPLPHSPLLVKRNRYTPHVGKKQLAKLSIA